MSKKVYYTIKCPNCGDLCSSSNKQCPNCNYDLPTKSPNNNVFWYVKNLDRLNFLKLLIWSNVLVYVLSILPGYFISGLKNNSFLLFPAPNNWVVHILGSASKEDIFIEGEYWRFISAVFLHGNMIHILFNMLWLSEIYKYFNIFFKKTWFPVFFVLTGIAGNLLAILVDGAVIGASGAVFGVIGCVIAQARKNKSMYGFMIYTMMAKWAVVLILLGFFMPNVSNGAHVGGLLAGLLLGYIYNPAIHSQQKYKIPLLGFTAVISFFALYEILRRFGLMITGV